MRLSRRTVLVPLSLGAAAACSLITVDEVRRERQPAVIRFYSDPMFVQIPEVVDRGTDFEVAVRSFGNGCVDQGDTEVSVAGGVGEVRPHDIFVTHMPRNFACPDILRVHLHRATLRFDQSGAATIRVRGRSQPGDTPLVIERTVQVR
jgi:hypothetical protein